MPSFFATNALEDRWRARNRLNCLSCRRRRSELRFSLIDFDFPLIGQPCRLIVAMATFANFSFESSIQRSVLHSRFYSAADFQVAAASRNRNLFGLRVQSSLVDLPATRNNHRTAIFIPRDRIFSKNQADGREPTHRVVRLVPSNFEQIHLP